MTDKITQPNDMFAAVVQKPDVNVFDLAASNIVPQNTQLLPIEKYKESEKVQKLFKTPEGKFDEETFNAAYNKAAFLYKDLATDKSLANALEYDPMDFTAPRGSRKVDIRPVITQDINPYKNKYSRTGINSIDENDLSLRELAQQSKVFDIESGKWLNKTATDFGFFGSLTGETLVYGQWDTDGEEIDPITRKLTKHKKGDWKYDENGNLFVETLGKREVYGKQIVNPMDLLTKEGSWSNGIDFFDSDGKDKSVTGTTLKLAAEIAPFLIPRFNEFYGGVKMAMGLASVLPTFYKAGEGMFLGDSEDNIETDAWKAMTAAEGFMAKFTDKGMSDAAQQSMMNYENLGGMVTDVFSQIYEQRAAANLSKLFYKTNDKEYLDKLVNITNQTLTEAAFAKQVTAKEAEIIAKKAMQSSMGAKELVSKRSLLAKNLNLGYMAMVQSANVYSDALAAGYDRRTAGLTTLFAASTQYGLMYNNPMGDWFLDKTVGYSTKALNAEVRSVANSISKDVAKGLEHMKVDPLAAKRELGSIFKRFKQKIKDFSMEPFGESPIKERIFKAAMVEGVEEVTEQLAIDASKGIADVMSFLGYTSKKGSFGGFSNVFSQKGLETYLANFIGGAIGGPMFELEHSVISPLMRGQKVSHEIDVDIYDLASTGREQEFYDSVDKNKHRYGSTTLSPIISDVNGEKVYLPTSGMSQADIIAEQTKERMRQVVKFVNQEKLKVSDEDLIRKGIVNELYIKDLKKSGIDSFILSDAKQLGEKIVSLNQTMQSIQGNITEDNKEESNKNISEIKREIDIAREKYEEIISGKKSEYYHGLSIFTLNPALHSPFISLTVDDYVKDIYNKDFYSLSKQEQDDYTEKFKADMSDAESNFKNKMKLMYDTFLKHNEVFSKSLKEYDSDGYASVRSRFYNILHNIDDGSNGGKISIYDALYRLNEVNKTLAQEGFSKHTLDSQTDISVGKFLVDSGLIALTPNKQEEKNITIQKHLELAKHFGFEKEEDEDDIEFLKRINMDLGKVATLEAMTTQLVEKLKVVIPGYENMNVIQFLYKIFESNVLTEEELFIIREKFEKALEVLSLKDAYSNFYNKLTTGEEITQEDFSSIGMTEMDINTQEFKDVLNAIGASINEQIDILTQQKVGNLLNEEFNKISFDYDSKLKEEKDLSDADKEEIAKEIDNIGLPSTAFNLSVLQTQIDEYLQERTKGFEIQRGQLQQIPMEQEQFNSVLGALNESELGAKKFKVKTTALASNLVLNVRRALLLKYAEDVIKDNVALDNETISELKKEQDVLEDFTTGVIDESDPDIIEALSQLDRIEKILSYGNVKKNSLYDKLRDLKVELFGKEGTVDMFTLLKRNITDFNGISNASQYKRTDVQLEQIKKALFTIKAAKAVVAAMSSTKLGVDNLYGFNVMLNAAAEREETGAVYETLESEATVYILKDLDLIEDKLNYLKTLAEGNSSSIVENQAKIQKAMIKGILQQSLDKQNSLSLVNLKVNGHPLFSTDDLVTINSIQEEELKLIELEHIFYKNFHSMEGTLQDKLDSLFRAFIPKDSEEESIKKLLASRDSNLVEDFKTLEFFDWYKHVHYILAYNSHDFYIDYENNVKNELSLQGQKAPFFTQQFALRQSLSYFMNKDIVGHIVNFIQKDIEGSLNLSKDATLETRVKEIENKINTASDFPINNIVSIRGSGGTGKSSVLGNWILKTLLAQKTLGESLEIIAVAPTDDTLNTLTKELGGNIDNNIIKRNKLKFFESILTADGMDKLRETLDIIEKVKNHKELNDSTKDLHLDNNYFISGLGDGAVLVTKKFFEDFIVKPSQDAPVRVIITDEMSKFTTIEWQILNYIAAPNTTEKVGFDKYYIVMIGDELQNGIILGENNFSMENILVASTVKLKNPVRARNEHQNANTILLENFTGNWRNAAYYSESKRYKNDLILAYSEEGFLTGTKIANTLKEEDLRKLDPNKEIVVITNDGTTTPEIDQMLTSVFGNKKIERFPQEVQGREFDQVILLTDLVKEEGRYFEAKNLYTLLTRAKDSTLVVGKSNFNITNEKSANSITYPLDPNIIKASLDQRAAELAKLTSKFTKEEPIQKVNEVDITPDPINLEENQQDEGLIFDSPLIKEKLPLENSLGYSFFNNLGIVGDLGPEYLKYTISSEDDFSDPLNPKITWETLITMLDPDNLTGTDLFSIPFEYQTDRKLTDILNEYVAFKNSLLFSLTEETVSTPPELFGRPYTKESKFILKKLNKGQFGNSYGKLVSSSTVDHAIYVFGKYITINDKTVFVTLGVMPDENNNNVKFAIDVKHLNEIYDATSAAQNQELEINRDAFSVFGGVQVPRHEDNSTGISPIKVSEIESTFPGVTIRGKEIRVFRDNVDYIREQFKLYETSEVIDEKRDFSKYRFRPYVILEYVEGNKKFSKLVILQADSRNLKSFWNQLIETQHKASETEDVLEKPANSTLISKYKGWELVYNFFESIEKESDRKLIAEFMSTQFMGENQAHYNQWAPFQKIINSFINRDPNISFKEFIDQKDGLIKKIITNALEVKDIKIANPVYLLYKLSLNPSSDFGSAWKHFMETRGEDIKIYYNTIITSVKVSGEGANYGTLSTDQMKNYTMGYAIESNKLLINMDKLLIEEKPKVTTTSINPTVSNKKVLFIESKDKAWKKNISVTLKDNKIILQDLNAIDPNIPFGEFNTANYTAEELDILQNYMNTLALENVSNNEWYVDLTGNVVKDIDGEEATMLLTDFLKAIYNPINYKKQKKGNTVKFNVVNTTGLVTKAVSSQTSCKWY